MLALDAPLRTSARWQVTFNEESLRLPDDPGQRMIFHGAEPGSESQRRLRLLASLIAQPTG